MRYKICYENDEYYDDFIVTGESAEECQREANERIKELGWVDENCWSEEIDE